MPASFETSRTGASRAERPAPLGASIDFVVVQPDPAQVLDCRRPVGRAAARTLHATDSGAVGLDLQSHKHRRLGPPVPQEAVVVRVSRRLDGAEAHRLPRGLSEIRGTGLARAGKTRPLISPTGGA